MAQIIMTDSQFNVCAKLIRSRMGTVHDAAKLVLVYGRNAEQARRELCDATLSDQQISNAVRRYEQAHDLIKTAYMQSK